MYTAQLESTPPIRGVIVIIFLFLEEYFRFEGDCFVYSEINLLFPSRLHRYALVMCLVAS